jgi:hypothetical protein
MTPAQIKGATWPGESNHRMMSGFSRHIDQSIVIAEPTK